MNVSERKRWENRLNSVEILNVFLQIIIIILILLYYPQSGVIINKYVLIAISLSLYFMIVLIITVGRFKFLL